MQPRLSLDSTRYRSGAAIRRHITMPRDTEPIFLHARRSHHRIQWQGVVGFIVFVSVWTIVFVDLMR